MTEYFTFMSLHSTQTIIHKYIQAAKYDTMQVQKSTETHNVGGQHNKIYYLTWIVDSRWTEKKLKMQIIFNKKIEMKN